MVLTQPKGYRKEPSSFYKLLKLYHRDYPPIAETMRQRHIMYNAEIEYVEEQARLGKTFVIYPDEALQIGRMEQNKEKMLAVYELGRKKGMELLPDILAFLSNKS